jgi:hypothetical protein
MESGWLWHAAQSHHQQLIDEAARSRWSVASEAPRAAAFTGLRSRAALRLRWIADRLEPAGQPQLGVLRAVAHHELDVDQALRLLGPALRVTARR